LKKRLIELAAVAGVLLVVTLVIRSFSLDMTVSSLALGPVKINPMGNKFWPAGAHFPWTFLYHYGPIPAFVLAGAALAGLVAGFFVHKLAGCRKKTIFILLFLAIGPGLVVNVLLKDQLGRPRPREVVEFGGSDQYTPCWQLGTAGKNSSFPSGHAAVAFFMIAPWFVLRDEKYGVAVGFLVFGMSLGTLVGIARILQGGHFVSDVIWSGGLIYLVGGLLAVALGFGRQGSCNRSDCS
jgi:membrane-associated PAP2 superfamily phosphatase